MEETPTKRRIYDDGWYYGHGGEDMAVNDLMELYGLTEEEVREQFTDSQLFEHAIDMREFDYAYERDGLKAFFDGGKSEQSDFINPIGGNRILVFADSTNYYFPASSGSKIFVYPDFDHAIDTSPSRHRYGNVFADCEIDGIWDENGSLFVSGGHHDGHVTAEFRQLSDAGEALVDEIDYEGEFCIPEDGLDAMGRRYAEGQESEFFHDLWNDPQMCPPARYMEQSFGTPALSYDYEKAGIEYHLSANPLAADHPARKEGFTYDASVSAHPTDSDRTFLVDGHFCEDFDAAKAWSEDYPGRQTATVGREER